MHRLSAKTDCSGGPCPDITVDHERGKTGWQGYEPPSDSLPAALPETPQGEARIEMDTDVFEMLLARHLTDEAIGRILALRRVAA